MADHLQDQILAALQTTLITAGTAAGLNVVIDGVDARPTTVADCIEIEAGPEEVENVTVGFPPGQQRLFVVTIKNTVVRANDWRKAAGNLAKQTEQAIAANTTTYRANGLASGGIHYMGSNPDKDAGAEQVVYSIAQTWHVRYRCLANTPDTAN